MIGTRNLFSKANKIHAADKSSEQSSYLKRLLQQGKQISQITAYIWRWADADQPEHIEQKKVANKLKKYFNNPSPNPEDVGGNLKNLFKAIPSNDCNATEESQLLYAVFYQQGLDNTGYIFPIFDSFELGEENENSGYLFNITVNCFTGGIEDAEINSPSLLTMTIPYPPRPPFGETTLDVQELDDWITNRDKSMYFADNHYIPTSCC
jgi:hypothetical protein